MKGEREWSGMGRKGLVHKGSIESNWYKGMFACPLVLFNGALTTAPLLIDQVCHGQGVSLRFAPLMEELI